MPIRVFSDEERNEIRSSMFFHGLELIKKYGLTHTSIVKITEAAGIGKSTFYNFFESKEIFVIELIKYERQKALDYFDSLLCGRSKITKEEAKEYLKQIIYHKDSIYQYLSEEDCESLYPVMKEQGMIENDLNSVVPQFLFDHFEDVDENADTKVFVNYLRIMALAVSQKESLYKEALPKNLELMFEDMFNYIFV